MREHNTAMVKVLSSGTETVLAWPWTSWPSLLLSPAKVGFLVKLVDKPNKNTSTPTPEHTGHNHAGLFLASIFNIS